jgi:hypothetical protein
MPEMMVRPATGVECAAEIAMTALPGAAAAMGLLPNHHLPRLILLDDAWCMFFNPKIGSETRVCITRARSAFLDSTAATSLRRIEKCLSSALTNAEDLSPHRHAQ